MSKAKLLDLALQMQANRYKRDLPKAMRETQSTPENPQAAWDKMGAEHAPFAHGDHYVLDTSAFGPGAGDYMTAVDPKGWDEALIPMADWNDLELSLGLKDDWFTDENMRKIFEIYYKK